MKKRTLRFRLVFHFNLTRFAGLALSLAISFLYGLAGASAAGAGGPGTVAVWGYASSPGDLPPGLTNVVAVTAGAVESLALRADGTIVLWKDGTNGTAPVPCAWPADAKVTSLDGGFFVIRSDTQSSIVSWSWPYEYGPFLASTSCVALSRGEEHGAALYPDGTVGAWSSENRYGEGDAPAIADVVAIASGGYHSLALLGDSTVVAWGSDTEGQSAIPPGLSNVVAITAGNGHSMALKRDGTVVAWGGEEENYGQATVPPGLTNVVAISSVYRSVHSLALKADGTVVAWGGNKYGQTNVPSDLTNVTDIAASAWRSLALVGDGTPVITAQPFAPRHIRRGSVVSLTALAVGAPPLSYQWQHDGVEIAGATNTTLVVVPLQASDVGRYRLVVSNPLGTAISEEAKVLLPLPPTPLAEALDATNLNWFTSGWFPQTTVSYDGSDAAQAGGVSDTSAPFWLETTVVGPGSLSFRWQMASDGGYGRFVFSVDDVEIIATVGMFGWRGVTLTVLPGVHTLRWVFTAGGCNPPGCVEAGWLDQVTFVNAAIPTSACAGGLDLSFTPGANIRFGDGSPDPRCLNALALQTEGKLLMGGWFNQVRGWPIEGLARLNADGSLDTNFIPELQVATHSVLVQPDGKILAGVPGIRRFLPDGSLDPEFSFNLSPVSPEASFTVGALAMQPDGKIIIAGDLRAWQDHGSTQAVARLLSNGTIDTNFPPAEIQNTHYNYSDPLFFSLVLQPDGKIIIDGLQRINTDGSPDGTYAPNLSFSYTSVKSVTVQPDGKILLGLEGSWGDTYEPGFSPAIVRLLPGGSLDPAFQPPYILQQGYGIYYMSVNSMLLQPDGKILVGGWFLNINGIHRTLLARLNPDGSLDPSFVPDITIHDGWDDIEEVSAMVLRPNGKLVIAGYFTTINGVTFGQPMDSMGLAQLYTASANPRLGALVWAGTTLGITLPTIAGKQYTLEFKDSLSEGNWTPVSTLQGIGCGVEQTLPDPSPTSAQRFYRVRIE